MKVYLEYKDEKSAKFWKIAVNEVTHTVTYGKIGTNGQSKTKTFESSEKALKEAEKLVKTKVKKGYQEIKNLENTAAIKTNFLEKEAAMERFNLKQYHPLGALDYDAIVLIERDLILDEGVYDSSIETSFFNGNRATERELIIIEGNLNIKGDLCISGETGYPSLLVLGDLHCEELDSNDNVMHISGDAYIKYLYYGNYNHGAIKVAGITHVPYLINSDHHSELNPCETAILINVYSDHDDSFDYHYYSSDIGRVFLEHLVEIENEEEDEEDYEYALKLGAFCDWITAGKSPFKEGAKPSKELLIDTIEEMAQESKVKALDLTEKKLSVLPSVLFEVTSLEKLTLGKNDFSILPEAIGHLINLKELNLKQTNIKVIPASIGQLKNLKTLNLAYCYELNTLPESIGNLKNLEVLDLAYCYKLKTLPESIGALKNLKKIILRDFKGDLPDTIFDLPQIDELEIIL